MKEAPHIPAGYDVAELMMLWCETPLHPGAGVTVRGGVDLPIQRERLTQLPMMQSSGIKGALRTVAASVLSSREVEALFGPKPERSAEHAGSMLLTDAHLLLFPVSSVRGLLCWITSPLALARFRQSLGYIGKAGPEVEEVAEGIALVPDTSMNVVEVDKVPRIVLLDEVELTVDLERSREASEVAKWLTNNTIPEDTIYTYIRATLPARFAIVNDDVFKDLTKRGVEVITRVRLKEEKVVVPGGFWSEEHLPAFSVLYCTAFLRKGFRAGEVGRTPPEVLNSILDASHRVVLGGHETVGRGVVRIWRIVHG